MVQSANLVWDNTNIRLGLGVTPVYRFDVGNIFQSTGSSQTLRYFNATSTLSVSSTIIPDVCARFRSSIWVQSWIASSSDTRIKEDIQDINDDSALQMILAIEPKTYKYIDKIEKGDNKVYGFIAQQIKEVIPEAISLQKSYIPNIMLLVDYNDGIVTLPSQPTKVIIKQNDKIKCYDKENKEVLVEVEEVIDELTFKINWNIMIVKYLYTEQK